MDEDYRDIKEIIKKSDAASPPANFTETVMARISLLRYPVKAEKNISLRDLMKATGNSSLMNSPEEECIFCFLLSGFFYFVFGVVLMTGLALAPVPVAGWFRLQPGVALLNALLFISLGYFIHRSGNPNLSMVKAGILFYVVLALINGIFIRLPMPTAVFFQAFLTLAALLMGALLFLAVRKAEHPYLHVNNIRKNTTTANMHGFTVIEVIAVLLLIGIISAFAISKVSSTATYSLKSQTEVIKNHLRFAQTRAMNADDYWGISFAGSSYTFFCSTNPLTPVLLPGEDSSTVTIPYGITTTAGIVVFDTWGKPYTDAAGTSIQTGNRDITVSLSGEPAETITITENTGFVP